MLKSLPCLPGASPARGQAVIEALVVLGALGSLVVAGVWLGRLQDLDLQLMHASRRVAFAHAHQGLSADALGRGVDGYVAATGHQWGSRQGGSLLADGARGLGSDVISSVTISERVPSSQPGDPVAGAVQWRTELGTGDAAVWRAAAQADAGELAATGGALHDFDRLRLGLRRQTAILRGTGAAGSDTEAQSRLAGSAQAWHRLAAASRSGGQAVQQRTKAVDQAWGRSSPEWDWLSGWANQVPPWYLQAWSEP